MSKIVEMSLWKASHISAECIGGVGNGGDGSRIQVPLLLFNFGISGTHVAQLLRQPGNTPAPCYISPPRTLPPASLPATLGRNLCELLLVPGRGCMTNCILSVRPCNHHRRKFTLLCHLYTESYYSEL